MKEFFEFSINTILHQRGIYPPESFKRVSKYGLAMMVTTDEALIQYILNIMNQLEGAEKIIIYFQSVLYGMIKHFIYSVYYSRNSIWSEPGFKKNLALLYLKY